MDAHLKVLHVLSDQRMNLLSICPHLVISDLAAGLLIL